MEKLWESYWNFMEILWDFYGNFYGNFIGQMIQVIMTTNKILVEHIPSKKHHKDCID